MDQNFYTSLTSMTSYKSNNHGLPLKRTIHSPQSPWLMHEVNAIAELN